ncbi:hypothetical protein BDN70DRAFT_920974 [Pholiota conissans]|uniref:Uncharacterized protein n=1 Tax=Pholiota conissans TaxID=109636 RepID=A0A9P6D0Y0_9AGAR|nr:hypothetical protein BDN70DRAFT_920974 [Pholiota conissans]
MSGWIFLEDYNGLLVCNHNTNTITIACTPPPLAIATSATTSKSRKRVAHITPIRRAWRMMNAFTASPHACDTQLSTTVPRRSSTSALLFLYYFFSPLPSASHRIDSRRRWTSGTDIYGTRRHWSFANPDAVKV